MKAYCTYCSNKKDESHGLLPAVERYESGRIKTVLEMAMSEGIELFILSGRFGFIHCETKIPWYDQRLENDQISALVKKLRWQLQNYEISELTYYTESPEDDPLLRPYDSAIEKACLAGGALFEKRSWVKGG